MNKALQQKFKINDATLVELVNEPNEYAFAQTGVDKKIVIVFVRSQDEVRKFVGKFTKLALEEKLILWCAFPKKSAQLKTDISRDSGWEILTNAGLEIVSIISLDETWSAGRFRKKPAISMRMTKTDSKTLALPKSLQEVLDKNPACKKFFRDLSFTNQKEYALWISTAKRPETIEKRLLELVVKLKAEKKNPTEK